MITFTVPMQPVGKARPRVVGRGMRAHAFTPKRTRDAEAQITTAAIQAMGREKPLDGALGLVVVAIFAIPKSWTRAQRAAPPPHTGRPDADNLLKLVADAMNGVCYADDCQVIDARVIKRYGERPEVRIQLEEIEA